MIFNCIDKIRQNLSKKDITHIIHCHILEEVGETEKQLQDLPSPRNHLSWKWDCRQGQPFLLCTHLPCCSLETVVHYGVPSECRVDVRMGVGRSRNVRKDMGRCSDVKNGVRRCVCVVVYVVVLGV